MGQLTPLFAVMSAQLSICTGAVFAKQLFGVMAPTGVTCLRLLIGALLLALLFRIWRKPISFAQFKGVLPYGLALAFMNLFFYWALKDLPLGIALGAEFMGPLTVAAWGLRRWQDGLFILLAVIGLVLILPFHGTQISSQALKGIVYALIAAIFWALYILSANKAGNAVGAHATTWGLLIASVVNLPFGILASGTDLLNLHNLKLAAVIAVLSSAIPYSLEMFALRRLPSNAFGVLTSMEPVVGAFLGMFLLHEILPLLQWIGICAILCASIGTVLMSKTNAPSPLNIVE
ncbi:EamA family transporter [Acetobacteraceae bacterium]|nr:EamA family transporter [Acetobacteraceae bacterium]